MTNRKLGAFAQLVAHHLKQAGNEVNGDILHDAMARAQGATPEDEKIKALEAEVKELRRIATDRLYMMEAYLAMLGPTGLKVAKSWQERGVTRQHSTWGPEAFQMTGEERAQVILDFERSPSTPMDFLDNSITTIRFDDLFKAEEGKSDG